MNMTWERHQQIQKANEEWRKENAAWCEEIESRYNVPSYRDYKFFQGVPEYAESI